MIKNAKDKPQLSLFLEDNLYAKPPVKYLLLDINDLPQMLLILYGVMSSRLFESKADLFFRNGCATMNCLEGKYYVVESV